MSIISYNNLFKLLIDRGIKKTTLAQMADISQTTLAKLSKNEYVSMDVLVKICNSTKGKIIRNSSNYCNSKT
jgi:DNA-binding Xre family transcriptional regulator